MELRLLMAALCRAAQPGAPAQASLDLETALAFPLDWERVLHLANHHEVIPLVYTSLRAFDERQPGLLPAEVLGRLKSLYLAIALRNQRLAESLLAILDLLAGEGIPALPFKGLALAIQAYGDISLRQFLDLDILIPEGEAGRTFRLLTGQGWRAERELDPQTMPWLVRSAYHLRFERAQAGEEIALGGHPGIFGARPGWPRRKDVLEVHWTIADRSHIHPLQAELLWHDPSTLQLLGRDLPTLSRENALLAACIHGASNQWQMLKPIADVAHLVNAHSELDWEGSLAQAGRLGFRRILMSGLSLAERVGGAQLPPRVRAQIDSDRKVANLVEQVLAQVLPLEDHPGMVSNNRFYMRCRERLRDRAYYVFDQMFVPKPADWAWVRLPPVLYPLYYLLRPVRLAAKFARLLAHKLIVP